MRDEILKEFPDDKVVLVSQATVTKRYEQRSGELDILAEKFLTSQLLSD